MAMRRVVEGEEAEADGIMGVGLVGEEGGVSRGGRGDEVIIDLSLVLWREVTKRNSLEETKRKA